MYLIHKIRICSILTLTAVLTTLQGCSLQTHSTPVQVNEAPVAIDQAMLHRQWTQTTAMYASGAVNAGSTRFFLEPAADMHPRLQQAVEIPLFLANTIFSPFTCFLVPPWQAVTYQGAVVAPTFNANPVLPPPTDQNKAAH